MTELSPTEELRREVVARCDLDYMGLGQLVFDVREALSLEKPEELFPLTLWLIEGLLRDGLIEAGMAEGMDQAAVPAPPDEDLEKWLMKARRRSPGDWPFEAWGGSPAEIVQRIEGRWANPEFASDLDRVCWFRTTEEGRRKALEWRTERSRQPSA